jgi:hypothetical protein
MRQSSRIESLSYSLIYGLGCLVAAVLAYGQKIPLERLLLYALGSWGYVIYYVMQLR